MCLVVIVVVVIVVVVVVVTVAAAGVFGFAAGELELVFAGGVCGCW